MYQGKLIDVTGTCRIENLNPARETNETHEQYKERRLNNKRALYGYNYSPNGLTHKVHQKGYKHGSLDAPRTPKMAM